MFKTVFISEWMEQAAVIDPETLTEQDVVDAYEADNIYACWIHGGKQLAIESYWKSETSATQEEKQHLKRGFEVFTQYSVRVTIPAAGEPPHLDNALIETVIPNGTIIQPPTFRRVALYARKERLAL